MIKNIFMCLFLSVCMFGIFTFYFVTPDIKLWSEGGRYMYCFFLFCAIFLAFAKDVIDNLGE